jgi:ABC-type branched-subunit amino acid transport system ATPase component
LYEFVVLIEQKCETSPVDRLLNLLRCLANKLHLIKLLTKRQTQQFPAQGKIKLTELKLLGHQRLFRERCIIWVEHIFWALAEIVDRLVVMDNGGILADGTLQDIVRNENVLRAYLGSKSMEFA